MTRVFIEWGDETIYADIRYKYSGRRRVTASVKVYFLVAIVLVI